MHHRSCNAAATLPILTCRAYRGFDRRAQSLLPSPNARAAVNQPAEYLHGRPILCTMAKSKNTCRHGNTSPPAPSAEHTALI
jgi:hypothetical protein